MLAGYGVLVAVISLTRVQHLGVPAVLAAHLAIPALAWLVVNAPATPLVRVLRGLYPIVILIGLYSAIDVLNRFGAATTWDPAIQAADFAIFGAQPSRDWWRAQPSHFWSALLHSAYMAYYLVVLAPVIVFLAQRRHDMVSRYLNGLIATYLVCYLCFLLAPVAGPYYSFAPPSGEFVANLPARMAYATLGPGSAFGAAFPSSHVAAAVAATIGAWHGSRRLGLILLVPTALLAVGVVYCQMHYAMDSATGLLIGIIVGGIMTTRK